MGTRYQINHPEQKLVQALVNNYAPQLKKWLDDIPATQIQINPITSSLLISLGYENKILDYLATVVSDEKMITETLVNLASNPRGAQFVDEFLEHNSNQLSPLTQINVARGISEGLNDDRARPLIKKIIGRIPFEWFHSAFQVHKYDPGGYLSNFFAPYMDDDYIHQLETKNPYDAQRARIMKRIQKNAFKIGSLSEVRAKYLAEVKKLGSKPDAIEKPSAPGGIDLNYNEKALEESGDKIELQVPLTPSQWRNFQTDGFIPVIKSITPPVLLPILLGASVPNKPAGAINVSSLN